MIFIKSNVPTIETVTPYTPLELEGRDLYISEGCYVCHSQMVRPFRWETDRYGEYSKIGEFVYDHPYQWGSRRIGPDLARAGVLGGPMYKNAAWHYNHFMDPQKMIQESIMPNYAWLAVKNIKVDQTPKKIRAMQTLGVPYPEGYDEKAVDDLMAQAQIISDDLKASGIDLAPQKQMIAIIAYMHKLGKDIAAMPDTEEVETHSEIVEEAPVPDEQTEVETLSKTDEEAPVPAEQEESALLESQADLDAGKKLFDVTCVVCHGADGKGIATFPDLTDDEWLTGNKPADVFKSISEGNVAKGMIPYKAQYSEKQIKQLTSYILITLQQ